MFSNNGNISLRQLLCMIVMETFTAAAIIIPFLSAKKAGESALGAVLICLILSILLMLYLVFISEKCTSLKVASTSADDYDCMSATGIGETVIKSLYIARFIIRAGLFLKILAYMVNKTLLNDSKDLYILLPMAVLCFYVALTGLEKRGRLIELLFWWFMIPIAIVAILSIKNIDYHYVLNSTICNNGIVNRYSLFDIKAFKTGYGLLGSLLNIEFVLFILPHINEKKKKTYSIMAIVISAILSFAMFVIVIGNISINAAKDSPLATLNIMSRVKLPFNVLERFDICMISFWIIGLFTLISGYVFYSGRILKTMLPRFNLKILAAIVTLLALIVALDNGQVGDSLELYYKYSMYVDIPLCIILPLLMFSIKKWRKTRTKKVTLAIMMILSLLSLSGCTKIIDIEDKDYCMLLAMNEENGMLRIDYISSQGGDYITYYVEEFNEGKEVYDSRNEGRLDYGHIKAILIGPELMMNTDMLNSNIYQIVTNYSIAKTVFVYGCNDYDDTLDMNIGSADDLGDYLSNMGKKYEYEENISMVSDWYYNSCNNDIPVKMVEDISKDLH